MKILFNNLGAIKNNTQSIDLEKQFYVLLGANNSGKTYVSYLFWTIFNKDNIQKFAYSSNFELNIQENTITFTQTYINKLLKSYASFLKKEMLNTLNIQGNKELQATILGNFELSFSFDEKDFEKIKENKVEGVVSINGNGVPILSFEKARNSLTISFVDKLIEDSTFNTIDTNIIDLKNKIEKDKDKNKKSAAIVWILSNLLNFNHDTNFLPATRSFLSVFYYYIFEYDRNLSQRLREDIEQVQKTSENPEQALKKIIKLIQKNSGNYTKPVNELIKTIFKLNQSTTLVETYKELVAKTENIMSGSFAMPSIEGIGLIDFDLKIKKIDKSIPAYLASSSVNQLTFLNIFLKHWAKETNNFLIIDEPEENLHPQNQIELLKVLILFATQKNNRVLITTHSPLFAEAINNYLYLTTLKDKFEYSQDDLNEVIKDNNLKHLDTSISLTKQQLAVYFFDGERVVDYNDDNEGVFFRDFREFSNRIATNNQVLSNLIYQNKQEENE